MRYMTAILFVMAASASSFGAAPKPPQYPTPLPCDCGDSCKCTPAKSCGCPALPAPPPAPPAFTKVCDASGCRLVPQSSTVGVGFAEVAALGQLQAYRQSTPFMHRGPVRSFFARLLGR